MLGMQQSLSTQGLRKLLGIKQWPVSSAENAVSSVAVLSEHSSRINHDVAI
jgi:hypothetical protein